MDLLKNRRFLFVLLALNLIGVIFAFYTYIPDVKYYLFTGKFFLIPFIMVSVWLYFLAFVFALYMYFRRKVPSFLGGLCFIYSFAYGLGSFIFYPLFMVFVRGISAYHVWNVFAHGFVGLQSFLFLKKARKPDRISFVLLIFVFLLKDFIDLIYGGFLYFVQYSFPFLLEIFLIILIPVLQAAGFYLLLTKGLNN